MYIILKTKKIIPVEEDKIPNINDFNSKYFLHFKDFIIKTEEISCILNEKDYWENVLRGNLS